MSANDGATRIVADYMKSLEFRDTFIAESPPEIDGIMNGQFNTYTTSTQPPVTMHSIIETMKKLEAIKRESLERWIMPAMQYIQPPLADDEKMVFRTEWMRANLLPTKLDSRIVINTFDVGPSNPLKVVYDAGCIAGCGGESRDWSKPDQWHRGYLHGRMQRYRLTGKMYL